MARGKVGRPTKYREEFIQRMHDYFNIDLYKEVVEETASAGRVVRTKKIKPNTPPTFEGFAHTLNVTHQTLLTWCDNNPLFLEAYRQCKEVQKRFLMHHGLTGGYNAAFAKFLAVNVTDLKEKIELEASGELKKALSLNYKLE